MALVAFVFCAARIVACRAQQKHVDTCGEELEGQLLSFLTLVLLRALQVYLQTLAMCTGAGKNIALSLRPLQPRLFKATQQMLRFSTKGFVEARH